MLNKASFPKTTFQVVGVQGLMTAVMILMASGANAQSSPFSNRQLVYGPLACAADSAYHKWLAGPLGGTTPTAASFSASLTAKGDPYTITFSPTSGSTPPTATYSIASSTCINSAWASVPASVIFPKGPLTLGGTYILALIAADSIHAKAQPGTFDAGNTFAYLNSPGSGVVIATVPAKGDELLVSYSQYFDQSSLGTHFLGCYKEQNYLVNSASFIASQTTIGCPG